MIDDLNLQWCRDLYAQMNEGGVWGVPRSALVFTKREGALVLTLIGMHPDADYQAYDYEVIRERFELAGIPVRAAFTLVL